MPTKQAREYEAVYVTQEQIEDLRRRMYGHTSVENLAVCVVTATELQMLLDTIEDLRGAISGG